MPLPQPVPVEIDFNVSIDADSKVILFGDAAPSMSNVIVAETKLPVAALYNAATSKGLIEIWEPSDALGKIRCQLANDGGDGEGAPDLSGAYQVAAKALASGLQTVLNGKFDCSGATPYKNNYTDIEYYKQDNFGRVALGAFAHYLFGHVDATAAITNDETFVANMLATHDISGVNVENWTFTHSMTHANLALRLVEKVIAKGKEGEVIDGTIVPSDVSGADTSTASLAHIVKQVIGQDSSRANEVDGSQRTLDKHLLLRFYANDVIYMKIALEPPTVEVSGAPTLTANAPSNSLVTKSQVTYVLKITLV
jgi:hypothetical protein